MNDRELIDLILSECYVTASSPAERNELRHRDGMEPHDFGDNGWFVVIDGSFSASKAAVDLLFPESETSISQTEEN
jgi:hypothetical protein